MKHSFEYKDPVHKYFAEKNYELESFVVYEREWIIKYDRIKIFT